MNRVFSVLVVDDERISRHTTAQQLRTAGYVTAEAEDGRAALAQLEARRWDVVLSDLRMPEMDGLALQEELVRRGHKFPVIVITGHGDVPLAVRAMRAGARDFIEKPFNHQHLLASIKQALEAPADLPSAPAPVVQERMAELTAREREVMEQMVLGHPNKVIAKELDISFRTVEVHRTRILAKMQVRNVAELVRLVAAHLPPS